MKKRELESLDIHSPDAQKEAIVIASNAKKLGLSKQKLKSDLSSLAQDPQAYLQHDVFKKLAQLVVEERKEPEIPNYNFQKLSFDIWGEEQIDPEAVEQMQAACELPVARFGALMPDAHVGYGLPIGGVVATEGAVIPYAVGVDIACRVKLSIFELPPKEIYRTRERLKKLLEENTRFGIGAFWENAHDHQVMDRDWNQTPLLKNLKDVAWRQLGTSGSGNHFVEFGELQLKQPLGSLSPGEYSAVLSHSGSRGAGAKIALHYSRLAESFHPKLPKRMRRLAWLELDQEGAEYWQAMELMGEYASANHEVIHRLIAKALRMKPLFEVENHHNFAWKETHFGKEVIVHRKGATPAGEGVLGFIPGTMSDPGYLVRGRGKKESLDSCSHGAGRKMSRKKAKNTTTAYAMKEHLKERGVELISAGLDESPHAYKSIQQVMAAQAELVDVLGIFQPKIVKMAPEGEKPED